LNFTIKPGFAWFRRAQGFSGFILVLHNEQVTAASFSPGASPLSIQIKSPLEVRIMPPVCASIWSAKTFSTVQFFWLVSVFNIQLLVFPVAQASCLCLLSPM
jgi:hypothetical protein